MGLHSFRIPVLFEKLQSKALIITAGDRKRNPEVKEASIPISKKIKEVDPVKLNLKAPSRII